MEGQRLGHTMTRSCILLFSLPLLSIAAGSAMTEPAANEIGHEAVRRDTMPLLMSLYLPIPLDVPRVESQSTGVFVPANYRTGKTVDLVVFLRGYDIKRPQTATTV